MILDNTTIPVILDIFSKLTLYILSRRCNTTIYFSSWKKRQSGNVRNWFVIWKKPKLPNIPNWIYKYIENLRFIEQNIVISFCPSLCLMRLVLPSTFATADGFQLLETVLSTQYLNITSNQSCPYIKTCLYNDFNLCYFVSLIIKSLYKSFLS